MPLLRSWARFSASSYKDFAPTELFLIYAILVNRPLYRPGSGILLGAVFRELRSNSLESSNIFNAELVKRIAQKKTPLTEYIARYAETGLPLWDELTVGVFVDPDLVAKQTAVAMDVDLSHGPAYGTARIWSDAVAPHLGERKVNIIQTVDVNRFVDEFVNAMQSTSMK